MKSVSTAKSAKKSGGSVGSNHKKSPIDDDTMLELVDVFKSLADKNRLQILLILAREGRLHVSAICDELGQSQPAVSHHLTQLRKAKLVRFERDGKFNHYQLDSRLLGNILNQFFPNAKQAQQSFSFGDLELAFKRK